MSPLRRDSELGWLGATPHAPQPRQAVEDSLTDERPAASSEQTRAAHRVPCRESQTDDAIG